MSFTVERILPMMKASDNDTQRLGASEAVTSILVYMISLVELIILFV